MGETERTEKATTKMSRNAGVTILGLILVIIAFVSLIAVQKQLINPNGTIEIYYSKKPIAINTEITDKNVNNYFVLKPVDTSKAIDGAIENKIDLEKKYVISSMFKNEQISSKMLNAKKDSTKDIKNLKEVAINFSDISEDVGGILRPGDLVDFYLTETTSDSVITKTVLKNVTIAKAFTTDGQLINKDDTTKAASKLTLYLSAVDSLKLDNALAQGKVKVMKSLDNSTYSDITIVTPKTN